MSRPLCPTHSFSFFFLSLQDLNTGSRVGLRRIFLGGGDLEIHAKSVSSRNFKKKLRGRGTIRPISYISQKQTATHILIFRREKLFFSNRCRPVHVVRVFYLNLEKSYLSSICF